MKFRKKWIEGKIFLIGGWRLFASFADVYFYDPLADKWERKSDLPFVSNSGVAYALNGKIYYMGGSSAEGKMLPTSNLLEYDPALQQVHIASKILAKEAEFEGLIFLEYIRSL